MSNDQYLTEWIDSKYILKIGESIREAIDCLEFAIEGGCADACYYLAKLYKELGDFCSFNEEGSLSHEPRLSKARCRDYLKQYEKYWKMALERSVPRALYDEAMHANRKMTGEALEEDRNYRQLCLERAFNTGFPPAVYEYAMRMKYEKPEVARELLGRVEYSQEVKRLIELNRIIAKDLADDCPDDMGYNSQIAFEDLFDNPAEVELNTRGDGYD